MTWLAYQHRRLILRLLLSQPRSALIRFLHRLLVRKPRQQGMEPPLDAFKVAVLTPTEHQALAAWQAEHLYLSEVARAGVDNSAAIGESQGAVLLGDVSETPVAGVESPGLSNQPEPDFTEKDCMSTDTAAATSWVRKEWDKFIALFPQHATATPSVTEFTSHVETEAQADAAAVQRLTAKGYTLTPPATA